MAERELRDGVDVCARLVGGELRIVHRIHDVRAGCGKRVRHPAGYAASEKHGAQAASVAALLLQLRSLREELEGDFGDFSAVLLGEDPDVPVRVEVSAVRLPRGCRRVSH